MEKPMIELYTVFASHINYIAASGKLIHAQTAGLYLFPHSGILSGDPYGLNLIPKPI